MNKKYTPIQITRSVQRRTAKLLNLHPSSYPYISGDTFRAYADHIHSNDKPLQTTAVRKNDVVFVDSANAVSYFKYFHPRITNPYILITHNATLNTDESFVQYIDDKIIHWFAKNGLFEHPKFTPLPLGLENKSYYGSGIPTDFKRFRRKMVSKKNRILYKFNTSTNTEEREPVLQTLQSHPFADTHQDWLAPNAYLKRLQTYAFVCSPPGKGEDCHRTWEAMYLGVIPIVKKTPLTVSFEKTGLPMVLLDSWDELQYFDTLTLQTIQSSFSQKKECPALWMDYWQELITSKKM